MPRLNNNVHESVGHQKTNIDRIDLLNLSKLLGYKKYFLIKENQDINKLLKKFLNCEGPSFLEVRIKNESIKDLTRPNNFKLIKKIFMN